MEMQQVRYFLAVARTLNFTRAAELCNVSQPALTRAIKQLELELGGELIRREHRLSHLTSLGEEVLPLLRQCFDSALNAKLLAQSMREGDAALVKIALSRDFGIRRLLPLLVEMHRVFPGTQFKLRRRSASEIAMLLKSGEADIAIGGPLEISWNRVETWPLYADTLDLIVRGDHRLARRNGLAPEFSLGEDDRVLLHSGVDATVEEVESLARAGIDLASAHEVETDRDLEAMIAAGFGVGIASSSVLTSGSLVHLGLPAPDIRRTIAAYAVAGRRRSREAAAMLNLIRTADWSSSAPSSG